jgi:hypothetical protein
MEPYGPGYDEAGGLRVKRPLSWLVFLVGTALSFLVFAPIAMTGWHLEKIPVFLAGTGGFAVASLVAAFFGLRFTAGLAAGRYRTVEPRPWREQVW